MTTLLPNATPGAMTGVLEIVQDYGGDVDAARIAADYDLELDDLLPPIQAAELLGFATTPEGNVKLTDIGKKYLKASLIKRKSIFRDQVLKTAIFQDVLAKLKKMEDRRMTKSEVIEVLGFKLWTTTPELAFRTLVGWGRHSGVLVYDAKEESLTLAPETAGPTS
ncbi:MAG: AAA-associated domain-containing protein [Thermoplasmatota archaeon]